MGCLPEDSGSCGVMFEECSGSQEVPWAWGPQGGFPDVTMTEGQAEGPAGVGPSQRDSTAVFEVVRKALQDGAVVGDTPRMDSRMRSFRDVHVEPSEHLNSASPSPPVGQHDQWKGKPEGYVQSRVCKPFKLSYHIPQGSSAQGEVSQDEWQTAPRRVDEATAPCAQVERTHSAQLTPPWSPCAPGTHLRAPGAGRGCGSSN